MRWTVMALAMGCAGEEDTSGTVPTTGASDECGDHAPVIETLDITYDGMSEGDACGAESRPLLRFATTNSDEDQDLHYWTLTIRYDDVIDGEVSESAEAFEVFSELGEACSVEQASAAMILCVTGDPPFDTELEWGVVIADDSDNESDMWVTTFRTPESDGEFNE